MRFCEVALPCLAVEMSIEGLARAWLSALVSFEEGPHRLCFLERLLARVQSMWLSCGAVLQSEDPAGPGKGRL
jgi:hypothetical protein